jgi:hypothetical protein
MYEPFVVLFPLISLPNPWAKGLDFGVFGDSRVRGVLGGIFSIPLDLESFGGQKLGYGLPMRCSYYPQSLAQIRGAIWEIGSWIWGCWPAGAVHPEKPRPHRSDQCLSPVWPVQPLLGFCSGEHLGVFVAVPCCCCVRVWVVLELDRPVWCFGAFWLGPVWPVCYTGLTGVRAVLWNSPGFTSRDRSDRWCSPAWPV